MREQEIVSMAKVAYLGPIGVVRIGNILPVSQLLGWRSMIARALTLLSNSLAIPDFLVRNDSFTSSPRIPNGVDSLFPRLNICG
jgi:hypothetical protein